MDVMGVPLLVQKNRAESRAPRRTNNHAVKIDLVAADVASVVCEDANADALELLDEHRRGEEVLPLDLYAIQYDRGGPVLHNAREGMADCIDAGLADENERGAYLGFGRLLVYHLDGFHSQKRGRGNGHFLAAAPNGHAGMHKGK